ncbi:MAG: hypothetical protein B7Z73_04280 [Planctomycetia bacterium 21-64-5]|nr:MAG: hypothetical protein B7Z73_04280 [Planctomycetia bacterium 21-64-5]HQU44214.1 DUF1805 domain-containing protein [Pirellulales bacterium]
MSASLPHAVQRTLQTPHGPAIGASYRWPGGQYCAIHTVRGIVGCGLFDVQVASEFGMAVAIAKGTPARPLCEPEDLYQAKIVAVSEPARELGIEPGMTGSQALEKFLTPPSVAG